MISYPDRTVRHRHNALQRLPQRVHAEPLPGGLAGAALGGGGGGRTATTAVPTTGSRYAGSRPKSRRLLISSRRVAAVSGERRSSAHTSRLSSPIRRTGEVATIVAMRIPAASTATSPKTSPAPSVARCLPFARTSTVPLSIGEHRVSEIALRRQGLPLGGLHLDRRGGDRGQIGVVEISKQRNRGQPGRFHSGHRTGPALAARACSGEETV